MILDYLGLSVSDCARGKVFYAALARAAHMSPLIRHYLRTLEAFAAAAP